MRHFRSSLLATLSLASACGGATHAPATTPNVIGPTPHEATVKTWLLAYQAAELLDGAAVAFIEQDQVRFAFVPAPAGEPSITADTWFELGSITKAYTGVLLADAIERHEVDLTTAAASLLPPGATVPSLGTRAITLGDLVTHRSGMPRLPPSLAAQASTVDPYARYGEVQLFSDLERLTLEAEPGTREQYSNFGAGLLGYALGRNADTTYLAAVQVRILTPLGLRATGVDAPPAAMAIGHDLDGKIAPPWTFDVLAGAGALRSTVRDQAAFVRANLAAARGEPGPLAAALRRSHELLVPADSADGQGAAMGWFVDGKGRRWHNGATAGAHSFMAFDATKNVGVVVLAGSTTSMVDKLGIDILDVLSGGSPEPYVGPTAAQLAAYAGTYAGADQVGLRLIADGVRLYSDDGRGVSRVRLMPISATQFYLEDLDAVVVIVSDPDSKAVIGVTVLAGGQQLDLRRTTATPSAAPGTPPTP